MPLLREPTFNADKTRIFDIDLPCYSGLNLNDLDYEQDANFSPNVKNMLYRNGTFGKRRGQKTLHEFESTIYSMTTFNDDVFVHSGNKIYKGIDNPELVFEGVEERKGLFINFNRMLYYICDEFYVYQKNPENNEDVWSWGIVEPYIPDIVINRKPDGSQSDPIENFNLIGKGFKNTFHGDGSSTTYVLATKELDNYEETQEESIKPKVEVDGTEWVYDTTLTQANSFKVDFAEGKITFKTAPPTGINNVVITCFKTEQEYIDRIMKSKYYCNFGGNNNSRLFLAGGGESVYYYSAVYDASYFPETNNAKIGNGEEDITGFGQQYNVLIIFKPKEIYSLAYYVATTSDASEENAGKGAFESQIVNSKIGCDVPNSIQLINNNLVWLSTTDGVCILTSTNILDERNVRPISRNINGGFRKSGLLQEENLKEAISIDYDNKYWLAVNGKIYLWDYAISPYANTGDLEKDGKRLYWFYFDNFDITQFQKFGLDLIWFNGLKINTISNSYDDYGEPIEAIYQTPLFQFEAVNYLKNVMNVYVQVRADTAAKIEMYYLTENNISGIREPEDIFIGSRIWSNFHYNSFRYFVINIVNDFRRKCSLKKVQYVGILFKNNEFERDVSISHLSFEYKLIKTIK